MADIVDLNKHRYDRAGDCTAITVAQSLREALRQVEAGEWNARDMMIIGITHEDDGSNFVETMHSGPGTTNERIGILARAQNILINDG